jgi:small-conductance mechanosensitive channel
VLTGFGDNAVLLDLRFWIADPRNGIHTVTGDVLLRVWDLYHDAGIGLPFAQRDLHLKSAVPVTVVGPPAP